MNEGHVLVAELYALAVGGGFRLTHRRPPSGSTGVWVIRIYGPPGSQYVMDSEFVPSLEGYNHLNHPFTATITSFAEELRTPPAPARVPAAAGPQTVPPLRFFACGVLVLIVALAVVVGLVLTLGR